MSKKLIKIEATYTKEIYVEVDEEMNLDPSDITDYFEEFFDDEQVVSKETDATVVEKLPDSQELTDYDEDDLKEWVLDEVYGL